MNPPGTPKLTDQAKAEVKQDPQFVEDAIKTNIAVKVLVAVGVAVCAYLAVLNHEDSMQTKPALLFAVPVFIVISACSGFYYFRLNLDPRSEGSFVIPLGMNPRRDRMTEFPFYLLVLDFVCLGLLAAFTGGVASPFLPLFVVALLLGDISVPTEGQEMHIWWVPITKCRIAFLITLLAGILLRQIESVRQALINFGEPTQANTVLVYPTWGTILLGLTVFLSGAILGSAVIGRYRLRIEKRVETALESASGQDPSSKGKGKGKRKGR